MTVCRDLDGLIHRLDPDYGVRQRYDASTLVTVRLMCIRQEENHGRTLRERGFRVVPKAHIMDGVPSCFGCLAIGQ